MQLSKPHSLSPQEHAIITQAFTELQLAHISCGLGDLFAEIGVANLEDWLEHIKQTKASNKRKKVIHKIDISNAPPPPHHLSKEERLDWAATQMNNSVRAHLKAPAMTDQEILNWRLANKVEFKY